MGISVLPGRFVKYPISVRRRRSVRAIRSGAARGAGSSGRHVAAIVLRGDLASLFVIRGQVLVPEEARGLWDYSCLPGPANGVLREAAPGEAGPVLG